MKIRNISPRGALDVPLLGCVVDAGAVTEVTKAQADLLLPQSDNWAAVRPPHDPAAGKASTTTTGKGEVK